MLVALSYCPKDLDQAERLADWIFDLGGAKGHKLLLIRDTALPPDRVAATLGKSFDSVEVQPFVDHVKKWPDSPNAVFAQAARHIEATYPQPWLWLEPDVVPMQPGWIDALWAEYIIAKKPFSGDFVSTVDPATGGKIPDHCSGVAIYPGRMTQHAGSALIAGDVAAFDMVGAGQIIPQMHKSRLLHHAWNHMPFLNWSQVEREILAFKPAACLFHASKDGSLIQLLRERNYGNKNDNSERQAARPILENKADSRKREQENFGVETQRELVANEAEPETQGKSGIGGSGQVGQDNQAVDLQSMPSANREEAPTWPSCGLRQEAGSDLAVPKLSQQSAQFTCDLFLKTFPEDYPWAEYCLRSIDKFCTGFRRLVIVAPDASCPRPSVVPHILVTIPEMPNGYNWQQVCKLKADQYTDADFILYCDSDTIFTRPVTPETYMRDGKIMWLMTPFENAREDQKRAWVPVMMKWMGKLPEFEWMRRHPFVFPRWLCAEMRVFCQHQHGCTLEDYVMGQGRGLTFSEFNNAGFLAYEKFRDSFAWINTETDPVPPETTLQKWSRGGLTPEIKAEFEEILEDSSVVERSLGQPASDDVPVAGSIPAPPIIENNTVSPSCGAFYMETFQPWHDKEQTLERALILAAELRTFCTAPRNTARIREILRAQKVIK